MSALFKSDIKEQNIEDFLVIQNGYQSGGDRHLSEHRQKGGKQPNTK